MSQNQDFLICLGGHPIQSGAKDTRHGHHVAKCN